VVPSKGGTVNNTNRRFPGSAGGMAAVRRTLATTICRIADPTLVARPRQLRDASTVMRFRPAHQSMINRRFDGRASGPARNSPKQPLQRKPRIYLPATSNGGHESGQNLTLGAGRWAAYEFAVGRRRARCRPSNEVRWIGRQQFAAALERVLDVLARR
jgi:hypothetical protein